MLVETKLNNRKYATDDEWYTTKEDVQYFIDNAKIDKTKTIWCPFDIETSNFVTVFRANGYNVISSHIWDGQDFYEYTPTAHWDIIISNPPFSGKHKLVERLLSFGKPWALLFGVQALNSEKFYNVLQKCKRLQYIHLKKRMRFTRDHLNYDIDNLPRPAFTSMWICDNIFEKDIQFWTGVKYKNGASKK